jgi:hypothetical protein
MMTDALMKAGWRTRVLRLPIVFLRVRCSILILLIKAVRCTTPNRMCICARVHIHTIHTHTHTHTHKHKMWK